DHPLAFPQHRLYRIPVTALALDVQLPRHRIALEPHHRPRARKHLHQIAQHEVHAPVLLNAQCVGLCARGTDFLSRPVHKRLRPRGRSHYQTRDRDPTKRHTPRGHALANLPSSRHNLTRLPVALDLYAASATAKAARPAAASIVNFSFPSS